MVKAGASLQEAYDMSWYEMSLTATGYEERVNDQKWLLAWHLAPILNLMGNSFTPGMLMGTVTRRDSLALINEIPEEVLKQVRGDSGG